MGATWNEGFGHRHRDQATARDARRELTPEQASRMTVTAIIADLEYWAHTTAVDGHVGLNDLTRTLDLIRRACIPEAS